MTPVEFRALIESLGFGLRDASAFLHIRQNNLADMLHARRPISERAITELSQLTTVRDRLAERLIDAGDGAEQVTLPYDPARTWEACLANQATRLAAWELEGRGAKIHYVEKPLGRMLGL